MTARRLTAVPDAARRAILYVRVSAVMGRDETFHSPDLQLRAMRDLIGVRGMVEVGTEEDIDVSGRGMDRPGLNRLLTRVAAGEADVVCFYDLARLGRNTADTLALISRLRKADVLVVSVSESIDDTPEGQLALTLFCAMAQHYSDVVGRRWRQVITYRAEQGQLHGGTPPLGYRKEGRTYVPDERIAPLVVEAFERYAAGELSSTIARAFSAARGRPTTKTVVKRMLANPVYAGRIRVQGREWPSAYTPLVDDALWQRVARRRERDARTPSRLLNPSHALVGLAVCDHCGYRLVQHLDPRNGIGRYECRRSRELRECIGVGAPPVAEVEAVVVAALVDLARQLRTDQAGRAARQARRVRAGGQAAALRRELARTEEALGRLAVDYARRDISEVAHRRARDLLEDARRVLLEQVDLAERVGASPPPAASARQATALAELWPAMLTEERNTAVRLHVREVRVRRGVGYREPVADRVEVLWL